MLSGLAFAPVFFIPGLLGIGLLCYQVQISKNWQEALKLGFIFGFGHFLTSMYWISIGVSVYIDEFWWAIPFALFGLPIILACFIAGSCALSFLARNNYYYQFIFCLCWVFFEWLRSWLFTGLPWNLIGYAFSFSNILIQSSSIVGIYGLSFFVVYISTSFYPIFSRNYRQLKILLLSSSLIILLITSYGILRLNNNPTNFSNIKVRVVQPSIPQVAKWDEQEFWKNLNSHITLSEEQGDTDLIIWSEAALVAPYNYEPIKRKLLSMLAKKNAILITGGITNNDLADEDFEIYTSLYALTQEGSQLFEYHKSHLVPFGEYMPLKNILPLKKITHGFLDYTEGDGKLVALSKYNLIIKPLICYETIFPNLVRTTNKSADLIINVTNDAWYGNFSGPYQHLQISRMRSVENGLPMVRTANNGISAIIDPVGRIINSLPINKVGYIDSFIPYKTKSITTYSQYGDICVLLAVIATFINHILILTITNKILSNQNNN
ncbi:MAG: apolipoprotein N-acyltransferase [Candidatus Rickettsia vulgarisii]